MQMGKCLICSTEEIHANTQTDPGSLLLLKYKNAFFFITTISLSSFSVGACLNAWQWALWSPTAFSIVLTCFDTCLTPYEQFDFLQLCCSQAK